MPKSKHQPKPDLKRLRHALNLAIRERLLSSHASEVGAQYSPEWIAVLASVSRGKIADSIEAGDLIRGADAKTLLDWKVAVEILRDDAVMKITKGVNS